MSNPFKHMRQGVYGAILADPPWQYRGYVSEGVPQTSKDQHYQTMHVDDMAKLPVWRLAAPDCALFMWGISSHLEQALWLGRKWGFTYSSKAFTWVKLNKNAIADERRCDDPAAYFIGMGHGTRRNTEDCWLFTRGNPKRMDKGVRELIVSPIREHSRKPDEAYERIERLFPGPYCELFSRQNRAKWHSWGNEVGKYG